MNIRQAIDDTPMSGFQWYIIGLATFLNALDGYDILAMTFSSSAVTDEFDLNGSQTGFLLSAALIGMTVGTGQIDVAALQIDSALSLGELTPDDLRTMTVFLAHYAGWPRAAALNSQIEQIIARHAEAGASG